MTDRKTKRQKKETSRQALMPVGDGCNLKYRLAFELKKYKDHLGKCTPVRTHTDKRIDAAFWAARKRGDKRRLPLVDGRKVSEGLNGLLYNIPFIDFDTLPPGFDTFYEFDKELAKYLEGIAVNVGSFSGRSKWALRVLITDGKSLTKKQALAIIHKLIPEQYHPYIDTNGIFLSFIHNRNFIKQIKNLRKLKPITDVPSRESLQDYTKYWEYEGELPELVRVLVRSQKEERFYRILLAASHLLRKGFGFSTKVLSNQLKIAPRTASAWLKRAIKEKILKCIDTEFIPCHQARRYKATKRFREYVRPFGKAVSKFIFPDSIAPGQWHSTLKSLARRFKGSLEEFLVGLSSISGFNDKDRSKQAISVYNWYKKFSTPNKKKKIEIRPETIINLVLKKNPKVPTEEDLPVNEMKVDYKEYQELKKTKVEIFIEASKAKKANKIKEEELNSTARGIELGISVVSLTEDKNINRYILQAEDYTS